MFSKLRARFTQKKQTIYWAEGDVWWVSDTGPRLGWRIEGVARP